MRIISDDIGSFPLSPSFEREEVRRLAMEIACGKVGVDDSDIFSGAVRDMMGKKLCSGIECVNYPQVQDMIDFFTVLVSEFDEPGDPWVVRDDYAILSEVLALESFAKKRFEESGERLDLRVCITGPLELYLGLVGNNIQGDLLGNIGKSVSRFLHNSLFDEKYMKTCAVCIDEPGLGLNPNLFIDNEDLIAAWETAVKGIPVDVQIHLHSVNGFDVVCQTRGINVIGVEYAGHPDVIELIDKSELESCDKFLRLGISRTDIQNMVSEYNDRYGTDLWRTGEFGLLLERMETKEVISRRLDKAYGIFGDRIRYAGPDCGLGSWPTQELALLQLQNTVEAISDYNTGLAGSP